MQFHNRRAFVSDSSDASRKLFRADHDVDQRKQIGKTFVHVVDISGDDRSARACCLRDANTRGRIVCIQMQHSAPAAKLSRRLVAFVSEPIVAIPDDGAFTAPSVDGDKGYLVSRSFDDLCEVDVHVVVFQGREAKLSFGIGSEASRVSSLQASRRNATIAVAVWPPADCLCSSSRIFVSKAGYSGTTIRWSTAFKPNPTASKRFLDGRVNRNRMLARTGRRKRNQPA